MIVVAVACVIAVIVYFLFRGNKNQFPTAIGNMTPQDRATVLVKATIWRMAWEADNPQFSGIFFNPNSFPLDVCNRLYQVLLDQVVLLRQNKQALDSRLSEFGVPEKLSDADINGCRVWMGTIGTRIGKIKPEDMLLVWAYLREAVPFVEPTLAALRERQEAANTLSGGGDLFLGQDVRKITQEVRRVPTI